MSRRSPLLLAFAILFGACQGLTEPPTAELGEPFWLDYGKSVVLPTSSGTLHFSDVLEDSRCPSVPDLYCVWAGRARIRITVSEYGSDASVHELQLFDGPRWVTVGGMVIEFVEITPGRPLGDRPPDSEYRAKFLITARR